MGIPSKASHPNNPLNSCKKPFAKVYSSQSFTYNYIKWPEINEQRKKRRPILKRQNLTQKRRRKKKKMVKRRRMKVKMRRVKAKRKRNDISLTTIFYQNYQSSHRRYKPYTLTQNFYDSCDNFIQLPFFNKLLS